MTIPMSLSNKPNRRDVSIKKRRTMRNVFRGRCLQSSRCWHWLTASTGKSSCKLNRIGSLSRAANGRLQVASTCPNFQALIAFCLWLHLYHEGKGKRQLLEVHVLNHTRLLKQEAAPDNLKSRLTATCRIVEMMRQPFLSSSLLVVGDRLKITNDVLSNPHR